MSVTNNIEICLEELGAGSEDECFIQCVAVSGGQPGLALDRDGLVRWMPEEEAVCHGLWVSGDGRLVLYGAASTSASVGEVVVERGARTQVAPVGKPVLLVDQDLLRVGDRELRVHIHGETEAMYEPERLSRRSFLQAATAAATTAASLTLGAAASSASPTAGPQAGVGEPPPIEVRRRPPSVAARKSLDCTVTKQYVKGGKLRVRALCSSAKKLSVGKYGTLYDKSGKLISKGTMRITSIKGNTVYLKATHRNKKSKAVKVRFWVSPH